MARGGAAAAATGATTAPVRVVLAQGARGELVRQVQAKLQANGVYRDVLDGDYGGHTCDAVAKFRRKRALPAGKIVDAVTWQALMGQPMPSVRDRALAVTAAFEGHGFGLVAGNFDGAGLTWGVIGFTLSGGELPSIVLEAERRSPGCVRTAFGARAAELLQALQASGPQQFAFADSISTGSRKVGVAEPWSSGFAKLGEEPEVQALQIERADADYFQPARKTARDLGLRTELGLALCFDAHVQNGGVDADARARIRAEVAAHPIHKERELRTIVAEAVADSASSQFREDVRSRKLTLATGAGRVHGATYVLRNWGLDSSRIRV